jgi:hypothetical protein
MDLNTLSIVVSFFNTLFLITILSVFTFPNFITFLFVVMFWLATQLSFLYYGIKSDLIGFIMMPIITMIITIVAVIVQVGDIEELEDIEEEEEYYED